MSVWSSSIIRHELIHHPRLQNGTADGEYVDYIGHDEHGPVDHVTEELKSLQRVTSNVLKSNLESDHEVVLVVTLIFVVLIELITPDLLVRIVRNLLNSTWYVDLPHFAGHKFYQFCDHYTTNYY